MTDGAQLFGLCGFAIAQPLSDVLGKNPTFFVAHDPSFMRSGQNTLDIYLLDNAGTSLHPLTAQR